MDAVGVGHPFPLRPLAIAGERRDLAIDVVLSRRQVLRKLIVAHVAHQYRALSFILHVLDVVLEEEPEHVLGLHRRQILFQRGQLEQGTVRRSPEIDCRRIRAADAGHVAVGRIHAVAVREGVADGGDRNIRHAPDVGRIVEPGLVRLEDQIAAILVAHDRCPERHTAERQELAAVDGERRDAAAAPMFEQEYMRRRIADGVDAPRAKVVDHLEPGAAIEVARQPQLLNEFGANEQALRRVHGKAAEHGGRRGQAHDRREFRAGHRRHHSAQIILTRAATDVCRQPPLAAQTPAELCVAIAGLALGGAERIVLDWARRIQPRVDASPDRSARSRP